jgi:hypothetical protein
MGFRWRPGITLRTQSGLERRFEKTNPTAGGHVLSEEMPMGFQGDPDFTIRTQIGAWTADLKKRTQP